ncbi:transmembrane protein 168 [Cricetulus griseus]
MTRLEEVNREVNMHSSVRPDGQPTLLPPEHVQELNLRSTGMLNGIQRFFAYHMIETYGCDYSTSGLSFDTLHSKLKAFLELRTVDGPRHDTYVLYYSGHTHGSGEWALADLFHTVISCRS